MENGFFKLVWRFNAIAIAFAAIAVIGAGLFVITQIWQDLTRDRHAVQVVNVDQQDPSLKESFSYGTPWFSDDNQTMVVPLHISQNYNLSGGPFSSGPNKGTRQNPINHLIHNRKDGSHRWLFPDNNQLIIRVHTVSRPLEAKEQDRKPAARLYEIVTTDSNDDKRLSERDSKTLVVTNPNRSTPTELIVGYDSLVAVNNPSNTCFEVLVEQGGVFTLHAFSISSHKQTGKIELPALPTVRQ